MLGYGLVRPLADCLDIQSKHQISHRRVPNHHHFVQRVSTDTSLLAESLDLVIQRLDNGAMQLAVVSRVVRHTADHVASTKTLGIFEPTTTKRPSSLQVH